MDSFPNKGRFKDLLAKISVGIEMEEWTLEEYGPLKAELQQILNQDGLLSPRENSFFYHGDSSDERVHERISPETAAPPCPMSKPPSNCNPGAGEKGGKGRPLLCALQTKVKGL